jgi:hypothetical protein
MLRNCVFCVRFLNIQKKQKIDNKITAAKSVYKYIIGRGRYLYNKSIEREWPYINNKRGRIIDDCL